MDKIDKKIILELQRDGRKSLTSLAKIVGLSVPALKERVERLEEQGVIEGYGARINLKKIGYELLAILRIRVAGLNIKKILRHFKSNQQVLECHRVTGEDYYIVKLAVPSLDVLDQSVVEMAALAEVTTSIVLSSPVENRIVRCIKN